MRKAVIILLLFVSTLQLIAQTNADSVFITISGAVKNELNNQPVGGHEVLLVRIGYSSQQNTFTDSLGVFSFNYSGLVSDSVTIITTGNCFGDYNSYSNTFVVGNANIQTNFVICHVADSLDCVAHFDYNIINGRTVQFFDLSATSDLVTWFWDFGDSVQSNLQNPIHTFSNNADSYQVCLTIEGAHCNASFCDVISFSSSTFYYGYARFNNVALENCLVRLIPDKSANDWLSTVTNSNGLFSFNNVPQADYRIEVIPVVPFEYYTPQLLPTYFPNALFWGDASFALPEVANQVNYITNAALNYGTHSIKGSFVDPNGFLHAKPTILLLDQSYNPITFEISQTDFSFELTNVDAGKYIVYPQLSGFSTTPIQIELQGENQVVKLAFAVSEHEIVPFQSGTLEVENLAVIYPNPTSDVLFVSSSMNIKKIEVYNMQGQLVLIKESFCSATNELPVSMLNPGVYSVSIHFSNAVLRKKCLFGEKTDYFSNHYKSVYI